MTNSELRKVIDLGQPFTLYVADCRSFEVPDRDFIFLAPKSSVAYVATYSEDDPDVCDTHRIPLLMVSGVSHQDESMVV